MSEQAPPPDDHAATLLRAAGERLQSGDAPAALEASERVLALGPEEPAALMLAGLALVMLGRFAEAVDRLEGACRARPDDGGLLLNLGIAYQKAERPDEAEAALGRAVALCPDLAQAHNALAVSLESRGRQAAAVAHYREALALEPANRDVAGNLVNLLMALDRFGEAEAEARRAAALAPDDTRFRSILAQALRELERTEEALALYQEMARAEPDNATLLAAQARTLAELGRIEEARAIYRRLLDRDPDDEDAHYQLSRLTTFTSTAPEFADLEAALSRREESAPLHFAMAKACEDGGEDDRAFRHCATANALYRRTLDYDVRQSEALFERIAVAYTPERPAAVADFTPDFTPVFIVGMPRSGSTLIDRILTSHPAAGGVGEASEVPRVIADAVQPPAGADGTAPADDDAVPAFTDLDAARVGEAAAALARAYRARVPEAPVIADKMLGNFACVGAIRMMFPSARIIHGRRDPMDNCLAAYRQMFARGVGFAYDLGELGRYYRAYRGLMAHWCRLFPDAVLEVDYEALVADPEGETRRLLAFVGLPFDAACLDFHDSRRPVRTASYVQVRRPIYRSSVDRWRRHAAHLGPLMDALGDLGPGA